MSATIAAEIAAVLAGSSQYAVIAADVLDGLKALTDASVDAAFFDPPYGLGTTDPSPDDIASFIGGGTLAHGGDFMGKDWQIPSVHVWREIARVMKPGAFACFYGGTQTDDLLSIGARMAGLSRADAIAVMGSARAAWVQAQGMPKHGNAGAQVDAAAGEEPGSTLDVTAPAPPHAAHWEGWHGGLAPKYEPLLLFQKPFAKVASDAVHAATGWPHWHVTRKLRKPHHRAEAAERFGVDIPDGGEAQAVNRKAMCADAESYALLRWRDGRETPWRVLAETPHEPYKPWTMTGLVPNLVVHGVGALNIGETRVGTDWSERSAAWKRSGNSAKPDEEKIAGCPTGNGIVCNPTGRFAPNVVLCHEPQCRRSGERKVRGSAPQGLGYAGGSHVRGAIFGAGSIAQAEDRRDPDGTEAAHASRCLAACIDPDCAGEAIHTSGRAPPACPECGGAMRWVCAAAALDEQSGERASGVKVYADRDRESREDWRKTEGSTCYADSGGASRFYPQFWPGDEPAFGYAAKAARRERDHGLDGRNPGVCVKPLKMDRRQVRQICPKGGVVLVPYAGTCSEVIAALLEGFRVIAFERNPVDAEVGRKRIEAWLKGEIEMAADEPADDVDNIVDTDDAEPVIALPPPKAKRGKPDRPGTVSLFDLFGDGRL